MFNTKINIFWCEDKYFCLGRQISRYQKLNKNTLMNKYLWFKILFPGICWLATNKEQLFGRKKQIFLLQQRRKARLWSNPIILACLAVRFHPQGTQWVLPTTSVPFPQEWILNFNSKALCNILQTLKILKPKCLNWVKMFYQCMWSNLLVWGFSFSICN